MENEKSKVGFKELGLFLKRKNGSWQNFFQSWMKNPSFIIIIFSNLIILFLPGIDIKTHSGTILWIYLVQSIMIGIVHFFKLFFYKFSEAKRPTDWKSPKALAFFFLIHYGFFHFVYSFFINPTLANWNIVWQGAGVFSFSLIINTITHFKKENSGKYNANDFIALPYVRIFPIHIAIILGAWFTIFLGNMSGVVVVLVVLKIFIELCLEYLQQLGISFAEIQSINNSNGDS